MVMAVAPSLASRATAADQSGISPRSLSALFRNFPSLGNSFSASGIRTNLSSDLPQKSHSPKDRRGTSELNLKHRVNSDMLLHPGYIPQPGVEPRVFHYGLEFCVGNWSFDKAKWRNADLINNCWSKFPDPPDLNTLTSINEITLRRDKLSIESMRRLNDALYLHHKRRHCPDPNTEGILNRGNRHRNNVSLHRAESLVKATNWQMVHFPDATDSNFKLLLVHRYWILGLWCISVLGFLAVISVALSSRNVDGTRSKAFRNKRTTNSGISYQMEILINYLNKHLY